MQNNEGKRKGTCWCGRSPTGDCCGWHKFTEAQYELELEAYNAKLAENNREQNKGS